MSKLVRLSKWPFEQDERVKLIWIGEPFSHDRRWMVKVYFRSITKQETKSIVVDWPTIHFLSVGKIYSNGIMNQAEVEEGTFIIDVNLDNIQPQYNERPWHIQGTKEEGVSRTFNFKKDNKLYVIPCIEVIRGILSIDSFTLRLLLAMDTLEEYLVYEVQDDILKIYFSNEYNKKLLTNEKLYHLAWIITNNQVRDMFHQVSNSYRVGESGKYKFEFKLTDFNIRTRVKKNENKIFIQEILMLKDKRIPVNQIMTKHPMLGEKVMDEGLKKREYITYNYSEGEELRVENEVDGASKGLEMTADNNLIHSYIIKPNIVKEGMENEPKKLLTDGTTKKYFHNDKGRRTLGEVGGENVVRGLEFKSLKEIKVAGTCEVFMQVMRLLEEKQGIRSVEVLINELSEIAKGRFAFLEDGITPRKYILCKIIMDDGKERIIIEIEREKKSLSTLVLKGDEKIGWKKVSTRLLHGLIKNAGRWESQDIGQLSCRGVIEVKRKKHLDDNLREKAESFYKLII